MWSEETQSCTHLYARANLKYTALLKSHAMWVVCVALEHDSPCGGAKKMCTGEQKKYEEDSKHEYCGVRVMTH